jgi:hypothetical protein
MTRLVPLDATAINVPSAYVTLFQLLFSAADLAVHVMPLGDVMTRLVPLTATATNSPFP